MQVAYYYFPFSRHFDQAKLTHGFEVIMQVSILQISTISYDLSPWMNRVISPNKDSALPHPRTRQPRFLAVRLAVLGQNWQHVVVVVRNDKGKHDGCFKILCGCGEPPIYFPP
jgi:hypothetical protein